MLEPEPVDKEAPQEGHQAVPVPGENTEALQATSESGNPCPLAISRGGGCDHPCAGTHTRTLCVCREMLTTPPTPSPGISELWGLLPGVDKRFSTAEDTEIDTNTVQGMANTGTVDAKIAWNVFIRALLVSVVCTLIALLLFKVAPAWTKDVKE